MTTKLVTYVPYVPVYKVAFLSFINKIGVGREFALMLTQGGRLYYTGKAASIGHKHPPGKWNEVVFSKSETSPVNIAHFRSVSSF